MRTLTIDELMSKVEMIPIAGCWIWTGAHKKTGMPYGWLQHKGRLKNAHRIFWEIFNGDICDSSVFVLHHCDNPSCVNPSHLYLGGHKENTRDKMARGRCKNGIHYGMKRSNSKISESDAMEIRRLIESGLTQRVIAEKFGIAQTTISAINTGTIWNA